MPIFGLVHSCAFGVLGLDSCASSVVVVVEWPEEWGRGDGVRGYEVHVAHLRRDGRLASDGAGVALMAYSALHAVFDARGGHGGACVEHEPDADAPVAEYVAAASAVVAAVEEGEGDAARIVHASARLLVGQPVVSAQLLVPSASDTAERRAHGAEALSQPRALAILGRGARRPWAPGCPG